MLVCARPAKLLAQAISDAFMPLTNSLFHGNNVLAEQASDGMRTGDTMTNQNVMQTVNFFPSGSGSIAMHTAASSTASTLYTASTFQCMTDGNDFTIELEYQPAVVNVYQALITQGNQKTGVTGGFSLAVSSTGFPMFGWSGLSTAYTTNASNLLVSNTALVVGKNYHIAVVRSGNTFTMYINGVVVATATNSTNTIQSNPLSIGNYQSATGIYPAAGVNAGTGFYDQIRITGFARYTAAFTPPTDVWPIGAADPYWAQTYLLLTGSNNTFVDSSAGYGNAFQFPATINGGLIVPKSTDFDFGSGNFTIELRVNPATVNTTSELISVWDLGGYEWQLGLNSGKVFWSYNSTNQGLLASTALIANTWNHVAIVKVNGTITIYVNGISLGSKADTLTYIAGNQNLAIGIQNAGSVNGQNGFNGLLDEIRITKGVGRYTAAFVPPTKIQLDGVDQYAANVVLNLRCNEAVGSTTFADSSSYNRTVGQAAANGVPSATVLIVSAFTTANPFVSQTVALAKQRSGAQPAMYFSPSYTNPAVFTNAAYDTLCDGRDFTVETYCFPLQNASVAPLFGQWGSAASNDQWTIQLATNGQLQMWWAPTSATAAALTTTAAVNYNAWNHIAFVRRGWMLYLFLNGTQVGSLSIVGTTANTNAVGLVIGGQNSTNYGAVGTTVFRGVFDEFRVTRYARYYPGFTPTMLKLSDGIANQKIMMHFDGDLTEKTGLTITNGTGITYASRFGYSNQVGLFDGSSNVPNIATSSTLAIGTGDFTLECWFKPTVIGTVSGFQVIPILSGASTGGTYTTDIDIIWQSQSSTVNRFQIGNPSSATTIATPYQLFVVGNWYHVVIQRLSGVLYAYVNGVLIGSSAWAGSITNTVAWRIGARTTSAGSVTYQGYMYDYRLVASAVYPVATTATTIPQVGDFYDSQTLELFKDSLLFADAFAQSSDLTGDVFGNIITVTGSPTISNNFPLFNESALKLVAGNFLSFPNTNNKFACDATFGDFTIEAWVNPDIASCYYGCPIITTVVRTGTGTNQNNGFGFGVNSQSPAAGLYFYVASGDSNQQRVNYTTAIPIGIWTHVAAMRRGTTLYLFVNGVMVASGTINLAIPVASPTTYIGTLNSPASAVPPIGLGNANNSYSGYIKGVKFTSTARYSVSGFSVPTKTLLLPQTLDPYAAQTILCYDFSKGNTNLVDAAPIQLFGNANVSGNTLNVATINDYFYLQPVNVNTPATFLYGEEFTIETTFNMSAFTSSPEILSIWWNTGTTSNSAWELYRGGSGALSFVMSSSGTGPTMTLTGTTVINANTKYHVAVVRTNDGVVKIYLNGVLEATSAATPAATFASTLPISNYYGNNAQYVTGSYSLIRVTKAARYRGNFTPPTSFAPLS